MMLKPCNASDSNQENATGIATPEPKVVQEQPKNSVRDEQDQFTDLVNWQKASIVSTSTVTEEGIVLTDDGTYIPI